MSDILQERYDHITQMQLYVALLRPSDVRTFNYQAAANFPTLMGITSFVDYIEIENSIDLSFRVGRVVLNDNVDNRSTFPIVGNEVLYIEYSHIDSANALIPSKKTGFFRVMSVEDMASVNEIGSSKRYTNRKTVLTLAEYPYVDILTFNTNSTSYGWDGGSLLLPPAGPKPISSIVSDFFTGITNRENTTTMGISLFSLPSSDVLPFDQINYYSPNWTILKNINFLKKMTSSFIGDHSYYYLNCEADRITFSSLYYGFLSPISIANKTAFMSPEIYNNSPIVKPTMNDYANTIMDVKFIMGNNLGSYCNGFSGITEFSFDFVKGHTFFANDYRSFKLKTSSNDLFYINHQKFGNQNGKMAYTAFTNEKIVNNLKKYEYAKKSFNSMICELTTFINCGIYLGQPADVIVPSSFAERDFVDPVYGENWCIFGYKDIISAGRGIRKLTLKKDSTWVPYGGLFGTMMPFN
jgi:hypothetical protein